MLIIEDPTVTVKNRKTIKVLFIYFVSKQNRTQKTKNTSNTDRTKNWGWTQVLAKSKQFLPLIGHGHVTHIVMRKQTQIN